MPEEEEGFTFVDKRRMQDAADAPAGPASENAAADAAESPQAADFEPADDAGTQGQGPVDVYSMIGYCVSLLSAEAWQKMGLIADPQTGQSSPDLAQAKVAVDAVGDLAGYLEKAPAEFVPDQMRRELRTLLNDLRLNFVAQQGQRG